ncbi:Mur ligase family protein [uncultured Amnibacterium sp.]|uniref:Mur ligase family protein n=1 Tax=uncultured Amnibacterium sp. TaxID=1631851 RepID=UPI0035CA9C2D
MSLTPGLLRPEHPTPRSLAALRRAFGFTGDRSDAQVTGLALRTQDLRPGDLFVAAPGATTHGAAHAGAAQQAGAVAVLTDAEGESIARTAGIPVLIAADPRAVLGDVAAWVHGTADRPPLLLLGVTGTNGKTTTVMLLDHLLRALGITAGYSTTAARGVAGERVPSRLTTPEADELHALIARMRERGASAAAVEVSAQSLSRNRIGGVVFDVVGFTNLTHDHLDEYGDMQTYFAAKAALFDPRHARRGVVSLDSPYGDRLVAAAGIPIVTIGMDGGTGGRTGAAPARSADWTVSEIQVGPDGTGFRLTGPAGERLQTRVSLLGEHAAADAAMAVVMLVESGFAFDRLAEAVAAGIDIRVPGRLERIPSQRGPAVYVDISHTPDAFLKSLTALRPLTRGRLMILFGADGDRDAGKRPEMGRIASELADVVLVTDHHSRYEDPAAIRAGIVAGVRSASNPAELHEVLAPQQAIRRALAMASDGDTVLWAGTGRTEYRDVRGVRIPYSFHDDAVAAMREAGLV